MGILVAGCHPDQDEAKVAGEWALGPILAEVPEASFLTHPFDEEKGVLDLKVTEEGVVWILNGSEIEGEQEELKTKLSDNSPLLRVWSHSEMEYPKVRRLIRTALYAGVAGVQLVVKDFRGRFGVLQVDHTVAKDRPESAPVVFFVNQDGRISISNGSGGVDELLGLKVLRERLEFYRSLAEMSGSMPIVFVRAGDLLRYGEFIEVIAKFQQTVEGVYIIDWSERTKLPATPYTPIRLPKIPVPSGPSVPHFPSIPNYK